MGQSRGGKYRRYTDAFKLDCILFAEAAGYPDKVGAIEYAAKKCGVPHKTLENWLRNGFKNQDPQAAEELAGDMVVRRGELTELFKEEILDILGAMKGKRDEATYKELAIAAGIFTEKLQLLSGGPTQNSDTTIRFEWSDGASDKDD